MPNVIESITELVFILVGILMMAYLAGQIIVSLFAEGFRLKLWQWPTKRNDRLGLRSSR